ncbi:MAG: hypothetical protein UZ11_BCD004001091 [Bacteroidetes bacterium OLB11]|nr:MAG: hypothetical protein UZ11_BCD004001091 [Bacteroidetes bacterium OLB11]
MPTILGFDRFQITFSTLEDALTGSAQVPFRQTMKCDSLMPL